MHWRSKLIHPSVHAPTGFRSLVTPVERGSTVVFDRQAAMRDDWDQAGGYSYGLYGTPTVLELAARIAELEGADRTFVVPGGQAALAAVYFAFCTSGSHVLLPDSVYAPSRELAEQLLGGLGIEAETYPPLLGTEIATKFRHNTALVWMESPGSVTMQVQDVPAITQAAHARGIPVALDNTYAAGVLFDAFAHAVDVSVQALTKYVGGHSDLLLGTVSTANPQLTQRIGPVLKHLGMAVSPDDASLALRGLQTLGVRLERLETSTLRVARWLAERPEVEKVLHPALPSCPGHAIWKRDFTGSASVFSIILNRRYDASHTESFADRLRLFKAGYSWGGVTSLATTYPGLRGLQGDQAQRLVRLNIGLEEPDDLIADLAQAFEYFPAR